MIKVVISNLYDILLIIILISMSYLPVSIFILLDFRIYLRKTHQPFYKRLTSL